MLRVARDPDLRVRLGAAARRSLLERGYLWEENARRVEELVAASKNPRRTGVAMLNVEGIEGIEGEVPSC